MGVKEDSLVTEREEDARSRRRRKTRKTKKRGDMETSEKITEEGDKET